MNTLSRRPCLFVLTLGWVVSLGKGFLAIFESTEWTSLSESQSNWTGSLEGELVVVHPKVQEHPGLAFLTPARCLAQGIQNSSVTWLNFSSLHSHYILMSISFPFPFPAKMPQFVILIISQTSCKTYCLHKFSQWFLATCVWFWGKIQKWVPALSAWSTASAFVYIYTYSNFYWTQGSCTDAWFSPELSFSQGCLLGTLFWRGNSIDGKELLWS